MALQIKGNFPKALNDANLNLYLRSSDCENRNPIHPIYGDQEWTFLHVAARDGLEVLVRSILNNPASDPNIQDKDGWTPLDVALSNLRGAEKHCLGDIQGRMENIVDVLKRYGATANSQHQEADL